MGRILVIEFDEQDAPLFYETMRALKRHPAFERLRVNSDANTGHYHNHFVINSVSLTDGKKFYNSPADYARMREVSDRLCREYAISVIENPGGRGKNYGEWQAEQNGKPTHRGTIWADIDRAIRASTTERDFLRVMGEMGYQFKTRGKGGKPLKYPGLKPPDTDGYFRFHKLGEGYSLEQIKERILQNLRKQVPFPGPEQRPPRRYRVRPAQRVAFWNWLLRRMRERRPFWCGITAVVFLKKK